MKRTVQIIAVGLVLASDLSGQAQSVPQLINYQGQLLDSTGAPLTNGDYVIQVRLFAFESGGTAIWGPQVFNGQSGTGFAPKVAVVQGRFNLVLGPQDTAGQNLSSVFAANPTVFIELTVGVGSPISPRQQVLSAPFALSAANAANAQNAVNAQNAANAQNAVNAQNATSAQTAVSAQNADTAQNAVNAQNAANAQNAVNAQTANSATSATSATTAQTANSATTASSLNGYNWGTIFSSANPAGGTLSVAAANIRGEMQMGTSSSDYHHFTVGGGNSYGYLYGSFPALADGLHLGYNYYWDASGFGHLVAADGATSRLTVGYGFVALFVGGVGAAPSTIRLNATTTGVTVYGTFNNSSDRNAKQDFTAVSPLEILDKVARLPLSQWSYKTDPATRHIGPMGQDFYSLFSVGTDEKHIAPIDEGGVALAAIQALNQKVEQKDAQIRDLEGRLRKLESLLESRMEKGD